MKEYLKVFILEQKQGERIYKKIGEADKKQESQIENHQELVPVEIDSDN